MIRIVEQHILIRLTKLPLHNGMTDYTVSCKCHSRKSVQVLKEKFSFFFYFSTHYRSNPSIRCLAFPEASFTFKSTYRRLIAFLNPKHQNRRPSYRIRLRHKYHPSGLPLNFCFIFSFRIQILLPMTYISIIFRSTLISTLIMKTL